MNMKKFTKALTSTLHASSGSASPRPVDESGCPSMEGLLLRKNAHGEWKKRHGKLVNTTFITNKPKHKKPTNEMKENLDFREIDAIRLDEDILEIEMNSGETHFFMYDVKDSSGGSIEDWYHAMTKRHTWAKKHAPPLADNRVGRSASSDTGAADQANHLLSETRIHISGYLQKKSHNKYHKGYQERFVKLEGKHLSYFKKKNDDTALGTASMETADFVRPYDATPDCDIFEIQDGDRVFVFQTPSHADMLRWVNTINKVLQAYKERSRALLEAKIAQETPELIRRFDEVGEEEFLQSVECELAEIYPTMEMEPDLSLKEHLACASAVAQYLVDFAPLIQCVGVDKTTRYDVLAAVMTEVNNTLTDRFKALWQPQGYTNSGEGSDAGSRHELIEEATLGDLHRVIDWVATYKITLNGIKCPTNALSPGCLSKTPKACGLWELMPKMCHLYVHGGSSGAKGGAASHLYDHCMKVWSSVISNPEEMIQKHSNGSFYTHAPIAMWEAINQHVSLATSTKSPILHVMIAEKVVVSLQDVFNTIITYVQTLDTSNKPELREIELEYVSALANDTALHIEEVIELIDTFTISEIRERIDDIFDPLTTQLVQCGQACLKRLASLVMTDVQATLDEVFMPEWLEGNQVAVATATISDYMGDFEAFLVEFWAEKFVYTILETVILCYIRVILFKKGAAPPTPPPVSPTPEPTGFFSSFMRKTKEISQKIVVSSGPQQCPVDEESLGRLAQDVNTFNAFFSKKAGQEIATEFLAFINEISLMLFLDGPALVQHVAQRATEFPSAAQAIKVVAVSIMRMRPETITKQHADLLNSTLDPIIAKAPEVLKQHEAQDIAEDRLSLLYSDLVFPNKAAQQQQQSLAQKQKNMAHVDLGATAKKVIRSKSGSYDDDEEHSDGGSDEEGGSGRHSGSGRGSFGRAGRTRSGTSTGGLVDDVLEVLNQHDEEDAAYVLAQEAERQREEMLRKKVGVLTYDGYMEKKSPAHNLWQRRWFKLTTRETLNPEAPYSYSFMWYKKEGGAVIKALEAGNIENVSVISSTRALSYLPLRQTLTLQSEALNEPLAIVVRNHDPEMGAGAQPNTPVGGATDSFVTIRILQKDGKDHWLRGAKVDRVIKWINMLSLAASLGYDEREHVWTRAALERHKETAQAHAASNSTAASPASPKIGAGSSLVGGGGGKEAPSPKATLAETQAPVQVSPSAKQKQLREEQQQQQQRRESEERARRQSEAADSDSDEEGPCNRDSSDDEGEDEEEAARERELQAKAAAAKRKAEELAAARKEAEHQQRLAEERLQQLKLAEEEEERERLQLEREEKERKKRQAARVTATEKADSEDLEEPTPSPSRGSTSNPIMQKDGKARDVANPIKRTSSVRRVPPPPPPRPDGDSADGESPASSPAARSRTSSEAPLSPDEVPPSPPLSSPASAGKTVRMVGKRRASLQKLAHNNAAAAAADNVSNLSSDSNHHQGSFDSNREAVERESSESAGGSAVKPALRPSEDSAASPAGGLRKSLSRGVSFATDVKERTSDPEVVTPPAQSPKSTAASTSSRQPFANRALPADPEPEPDAEDNNNNPEDDESGDISTHVARAGVVSGKMYRKSVLVSTMPKAPNAPPQKEGYLMKKSPAMLVGWQKRFFVTNSNGDLEYYKSEADAHNGSVPPQGVIMIQYISLDRGVQVDDKSGELSIRVGTKTIHLKGKDKSEGRAWQSSITQWQLHTA